MILQIRSHSHLQCSNLMLAKASASCHNVIRIFDLSQAKGIKLITMEFVEGHDP